MLYTTPVDKNRQEHTKDQKYGKNHPRKCQNGEINNIAVGEKKYLPRGMKKF